MAAVPSPALVEAPEHFIQEAKEANDQELHRATPPALAIASQDIRARPHADVVVSVVS